MILMMILFLGATIFLVMWGVRQFTGRELVSGSRAMEILEERYARGEGHQEPGFSLHRSRSRGLSHGLAKRSPQQSRPPCSRPPGPNRQFAPTR